jgi:hypothetical protein
VVKREALEGDDATSAVRLVNRYAKGAKAEPATPAPTPPPAPAPVPVAPGSPTPPAP